MRFLFKSKDGGRESTVTGYWLIEAKRLFSICLLRFDGESREAYHSHAFNCLSWVLKGCLLERFLLSPAYRVHRASWLPFVTRRTDFHKVDSIAVQPTWVLSIRGPWIDSWREFLPATRRFLNLTHGRHIVANRSFS